MAHTSAGPTRTLRDRSLKTSSRVGVAYGWPQIGVASRRASQGWMDEGKGPAEQWGRSVPGAETTSDSTAHRSERRGTPPQPGRARPLRWTFHQLFGELKSGMGRQNGAATVAG